MLTRVAYKMPDWLPEILEVDPWRAETYDYLYDIFCRDIRDSRLRYKGKDVWIFHQLEDGKEEVFWHLTTRKPKPKRIPRHKLKFYPPGQTHEPTGERLPDPDRCARLNWVKPLIENSNDPEVLSWDYEEGNEAIKTYVWLKELNFVVIMKKYGDGKRRLITAFYVDRGYKDYERKYAQRIQ